MGYKSRSVYVSYCIRKCENRGKKCKQCLRFSEFKEKGVAREKANHIT